MTMAGTEFAIRRWKTSYFREPTKKWVYGDLIVTIEGIKCIVIPDKKSKDDAFELFIGYSEITRMMKAKSMLIYDSIVILIGNSQHWFSSLQNRDAVYNVIEHFWQERLTERNVKETRIKQRTRLGQEIMRLNADSERTLCRAGEELHHQGVQLENAFGVMDDIHSDLETAENLVSGLESWLGRWRLPPARYVPEPMEIVNKNELLHVVDIPIVYTSHVYAHEILNKPGICRVSSEGITILDCKQSLVQHYSPKNVSSLRIVSPWEIVVSRNMVGKPDVAYTMISSQMTGLVHMLEPVYRRKMQYDNPPNDLDCQVLAQRCGSPKHQKGVFASRGQGPNASSLSSSFELQSIPATKPQYYDQPAGGQQQIQSDQSQQAVSEKEVQEISNQIARMKSMAIDISAEQERQVEKIDNLTQTVVNADGRVKATTTRMNRLM